MTEENKVGGEDQGNKDTVSKADYDALVAEGAKTAKDLEEMRLEVLSPEYMQFLNNKTVEPKVEEKPVELTEEALEKMSKKDILKLATDSAKKALEGDLEKIRTESANDKKSRSAREISAFAEAHDDFETFRPIMHGLSMDPKHSNKPLSGLYKLAKELVGRVRMPPSEEEIAKQKKMGGEKPGGASESFDDLRKLSSEDATAKALSEVKESLGSFPLA